MTPEERNELYGNPKPKGVCSVEGCEVLTFGTLGSKLMCAGHIDAFRQRIMHERELRERKRHEENLAVVFDWLGLS